MFGQPWFMSRTKTSRVPGSAAGRSPALSARREANAPRATAWQAAGQTSGPRVRRWSQSKGMAAYAGTDGAAILVESQTTGRHGHQPCTCEAPGAASAPAAAKTHDVTRTSYPGPDDFRRRGIAPGAG